MKEDDESFLFMGLLFGTIIGLILGLMFTVYVLKTTTTETQARLDKCGEHIKRLIEGE